MIIDPAKTYTATMVTSTARSRSCSTTGRPVTVNSFVYLARFHYYDGVIFHRIIPASCSRVATPAAPVPVDPVTVRRRVAQGRALRSRSLAMANAGPHTNGSQFFIISGPDGVRLPPLYALFGKVVKGLDVVAKVNDLGTSSGKPREGVVIESVTITES